MQEYEFWPDKIAKELVKKWKVKKQVITTGTSMSGEPHIGSANDVVRADAIRLALVNIGAKVDLIWISDNMDPFRSVPADMPKELINYLGIPACNIPDFWGCHKSFTTHFEDKFIEELKILLTKPKILLGNEMYKKGMYNEMILLAMEKRQEIAKILNKYRTQPLPKEWYPVNIICENCGKISTTKILSYENGEAEYVCSESEKILHKKYAISGCGYVGKVSILNGHAKLTWRVEWPARWVFLKTTCEPFGKEHAAAGGSWDTGKKIVKLLGWKPPYPVVYEHFLVNGQKMSKSLGNVITVSDMLKYMTPQQLRYWLFQGRLTIAKNIVLSKLVPQTFKEFDKAERIFFGIESTKNKRKDQNYKRAYLLAVVKPKRSIQIPFNVLLEIVKILPESGQLEFAIKKLKEMGYVEAGEKAQTEIERKLALVKKYYEDFLKPKAVEIKLTENERKAIADLVKEIEKETEGEILQTKIFKIAQSYGLIPAEFFKILYKIIFGIEKGPRLGPYLIAAKSDVIKKLKNAIK